MASANFLSVKTHLSDFKSNSDKDTMSEASESGTSNSVTSSEDLQKLAVILGLNSAEDVYQERFRVDRRRLEAMLAENLEESQTAQVFFHRVMNETNTLINWPARLKIGARSKKDPHVRIAGRPDDVKLAREKIMQLLDTRSNRVTMKIDVSYTDHSHIIGKGGLTIKRVMEETGCHIHFPDSNRTSTQEKSNQVSIAGDMERVERARARVRALTPLVFCFELPIVAPSQPLPDISSPYVQQIQEQYNVQVMLRNRPKLHANLLVVKGVQWEVHGTMEATTLLMNYMCGPLANQTQVQMSLEISPMHHPVVVGRNAEQLKVIMKGTNTQIMFPDADDPNIPVLRKSCVTITGQIKDVYTARQQLVGSFPLVVIFDVAEEQCRVEGDAVSRLMDKHRVYISVRRKPKQGIASVVIKGIERCAGDIYEARRELLNNKEPSITAEVPESYNIPSLSNVMPNFSPFSPFSPHAPYMLYNPPLSPASPYPSWMLASPQPRQAQFHFPAMPAPVVYKNQGSWNPLSGMQDAGENMPCLQVPPEHRHVTQLLNSSSQASSGYQSNFTGSSVSLDTQNISAGDGSNVVSPSVSPISKTHSPTPCSDNDRSQHGKELANIISELHISDRRAVGCEKKTLETLTKMSPSPLSDYRKMQSEANKAMRESVSSGYRVPTTRWSGYYFSHTSPNPLKLNENDGMTTPEKGWNRSDLVRPNIVEPEPSPSTSKPCRYQQLYDLLRDIGLHKYIGEDDYNNMSKFLNRILGMPVDLQNRLFKYFTDTLAAVMEQAKRSGRFDLGILDLGSTGESVRRVRCVRFLRRHATGQAPVELHTVHTERGMEWSQALEKWRTAQAEAEADYTTTEAGGFYISAAARGGKHTAVLCIAQRSRRDRERERSKSKKDLMLQVYRPNTGLQIRLESVAEIEKKYRVATTEEAGAAWRAQHAASLRTCAHAYWRSTCRNAVTGTCEVGLRVRTYHVLAGSVLAVWARVEAALAARSAGKMQVVRIKTDDGLKLVGTLIPKNCVETLKETLSSDAVSVTEQTFDEPDLK